MNIKLYLPFKPDCVLLANGESPTHPIPIRVLQQCPTHICCDGAEKLASTFGIIPDVIIGDLDSLRKQRISSTSKIIRVDNQNKTDLEKTVQWCIDCGLRNIVLIGSTGLREDHSLANLLLLTQIPRTVNLVALTNHFAIHRVFKRIMFRTWKGQIISLQSFSRRIKISTKGLLYNLQNESLKSAGRGTSNQAKGKNVTIHVSEGVVLAFFGYPKR